MNSVRSISTTTTTAAAAAAAATATATSGTRHTRTCHISSPNVTNRWS